MTAAANQDFDARIPGAVDRGPQVAVSVNGRDIRAFEGESLAVALFIAGVRRLRSSPRAAGARGMFCLMGVCQECMVEVDGRRALACQVAVRSGMQVRTGDGT